MYRAAWRKFKSQQTLSPLEKQLVAVLSEHPEYHVIVESAVADLANYSPRGGQLNPWLHMGLHLAIREQVAANRPAGIAQVHAQLAARAGGAHEAEHRMLEVLAEAAVGSAARGQVPRRKRLPGTPAGTARTAERFGIFPAPRTGREFVNQCPPRTPVRPAPAGAGLHSRSLPDRFARDIREVQGMGLSETILAAIIGALATMATAIVQILRNRAPAEARPKKNRVRSTFAIIALVFGAMVGGYFWSELRAVGAREEIAALRADLKLAAKAEIAPGATAVQPQRLQPILARRTQRSRRSRARVAAPNPWRTCRPAASRSRPKTPARSHAPNLWRRPWRCAQPSRLDPHHRRARACARAEERYALART